MMLCKCRRLCEDSRVNDPLATAFALKDALVQVKTYMQSDMSSIFSFFFATNQSAPSLCMVKYLLFLYDPLSLTDHRSTRQDQRLMAGYYGWQDFATCQGNSTIKLIIKYDKSNIENKISANLCRLQM